MADELTRPLTPIDRVATRVVYGEMVHYEEPKFLKHDKINIFKIQPKCATERNRNVGENLVSDEKWQKIVGTVGRKYGRLTVIGKALKDSGNKIVKRKRGFLYVCRCVCSNYTLVRYDNLKKNNTTMCPSCKHLQYLKEGTRSEKKEKIKNSILLKKYQKIKNINDSMSSYIESLK